MFRSFFIASVMACAALSAEEVAQEEAPAPVVETEMNLSVSDAESRPTDELVDSKCKKRKSFDYACGKCGPRKLNNA
ncbi:MAG: hypothetical protein HYX48_02865 [Chlamydiales bacterium]|nr:hypothetical protein [Chlamydiales bacterium]